MSDMYEMKHVAALARHATLSNGVDCLVTRINMSGGISVSFKASPDIAANHAMRDEGVPDAVVLNAAQLSTVSNVSELKALIVDAANQALQPYGWEVVNNHSQVNAVVQLFQADLQDSLEYCISHAGPVALSSKLYIRKTPVQALGGKKAPRRGASGRGRSRLGRGRSRLGKGRLRLGKGRSRSGKGRSRSGKSRRSMRK